MPKRRLLWLVSLVTVPLTLSAGPARAQCEFDGTVPGTGPSVTAVGVQGVATFYVDDRDWLDLDNDGVAGGLWVYMESNGVEGLQRGGPHPGLVAVDEIWWPLWDGYVRQVPHEVYVPPNPGGLPILPYGFRYSPLECWDTSAVASTFCGPREFQHQWYDPCLDWQGTPEATGPDTLLF